MPEENITSLCFGGDNLDEAFVTSAQNEQPNSKPRPALFRMRLGVRGVPDFRSRIIPPRIGAS